MGEYGPYVPPRPAALFGVTISPGDYQAELGMYYGRTARSGAPALCASERVGSCGLVFQ